MPDRRRLRDEQIAHQALDLVPGDHHITEQLPQQPSCRVADPRRHRHDRTSDAEDAGQLLDQPAVGEGLGSDRIDDAIRAPGALRHREIREVLDVDGLQAIPAVSTT